MNDNELIELVDDLKKVVGVNLEEELGRILAREALQRYERLMPTTKVLEDLQEVLDRLNDGTYVKHLDPITFVPKLFMRHSSVSYLMTAELQAALQIKLREQHEARELAAAKALVIQKLSDEELVECIKQTLEFRKKWKLIVESEES